VLQLVAHALMTITGLGMSYAYHKRTMTRNFIKSKPRLTHQLLVLAAVIGLEQSVHSATSLVFTNAMLLPNKQIHVQLTTVPGQSYTFEVSTNLVTWQAVGVMDEIETNLLTLVDEEPIAAHTCLFYRARVGASAIYSLDFVHQAEGGYFDSGPTPSVSYPRGINSYAAVFDVEHDAPYPAPTSVFFSGPPASGMVNSAATSDSQVGSSHSWYQSPGLALRRMHLVGNGQSCKRCYRTLDLADPQAASRFIVIVPTVTVADGCFECELGVLLGGDWELLPTRPAYISSVQVQVDTRSSGRAYDSPEIDDPATKSHALAQPVSWGDVSNITMAFNDSLLNHYITFFRKN
jgi:hypothetical protein